MKPFAVLMVLVTGALVAGRAVGQLTPAVDEPYAAFVPKACDYLTAELAATLLGADAVVAGDANLHDARLSQCMYTAGEDRSVGFTFKFLPREQFDVSRLTPLQLELNVTAAAGGLIPDAKLDDPGKAAFIFQQGDRSQLLVITGIQGPPDSVGRATELIAVHYLVDSSREHEARLADLTVQARSQLREWLAGGPVADFQDSESSSVVALDRSG